MNERVLTLLAEFNNPIEAEMAKSLLESENIYAEIGNEYMSALYPTGAIPTDLLVFEDDVERARQLLEIE